MEREYQLESISQDLRSKLIDYVAKADRHVLTSCQGIFGLRDEH